MTIQINDPWFESLYNREFGANPTKFLEEVKTLLVENYQRKKRVISLLKKYVNEEISVGKIAEKLVLSREEVLDLMKENNVYLVDYDFSKEDKTIEKYLRK